MTKYDLEKNLFLIRIKETMMIIIMIKIIIPRDQEVLN